ncbi:YcxB family protein [Actinoplanes sp. NEAU-A12]|uniref:YcxB family protein n=1 Tax=Actinoplanes sandaracinus TaxID=3045177 RepID=A0ABT6WLG3_9ACTN|nr:YcxB family protein [Actinoplanes sandaracinus]MDI6100548.1 YcxB family protein [Actinoplanes sandaracinus]
MNVTGSHQFGYREIRRVSMEALGKKRYGMWILGALLLLCTALKPEGAGLLPWFAVFMLAFPDLIAYVTWHPQRQINAHPVHYELDDAEIRIRTISSEVKLAWAGLTWIRPYKRMWLIRHGAAQTVIPRAAFSPEDLVTLDAFFAARGIQAAA